MTASKSSNFQYSGHTGLPDGKKNVFLYNTPGGRFNWNQYSDYEGKAVWYWYYDVGPDDRDRKKKLLEKQKKGKARMRQFGSVDIPQEAFIEVLKINKEK